MIELFPATIFAKSSVEMTEAAKPTKKIVEMVEAEKPQKQKTMHIFFETPTKLTEEEYSVKLQDYSMFKDDSVAILLKNRI